MMVEQFEVYASYDAYHKAHPEVVGYSEGLARMVITDLYDEEVTQDERNMLMNAYMAGLLYAVANGVVAAAEEFNTRNSEWAVNGWMAGRESVSMTICAQAVDQMLRRAGR